MPNDSSRTIILFSGTASPDDAAKRQRTSTAHTIADDNPSENDQQDEPTTSATPLKGESSPPA